MYTIEWLDCEPSHDNIIQNIKTIDPYHKLDIMTLLIHSYYNFYHNSISSYEVEAELRKHNLNVGLIAVDWTKDPHYKKIVDEGKGKIVKRRYFSTNQDKLSKYVTFISCRPREYVVKETLSHSKTMGENLDKLKKSGDVVVTTTENVLAAKDIVIDQNDLTNAIQQGRKLLRIVPCSLKDVFSNCIAKNPGATIVMIDGRRGVIVLDGQIICPVCMVAQYDTIRYELIEKN